jgi:hypothetical protein
MSIVLCALFSVGYSQQKPCDPIDIQKVTLKDTFLIQQLEKLIGELEIADSLFKQGIGYIFLYTIRPKDSGSTYGYHFFPGAVSVVGWNDEAYPQYYSIVRDRPVLIYFNFFNSAFCRVVRSKSKRRLNNIIEPFLPEKTEIKARDKNGNVIIEDKNFREEFHYGHGAGRVITYFKNRPPVVRQSSYND